MRSAALIDADDAADADCNSDSSRGSKTEGSDASSAVSGFPLLDLLLLLFD